jgi:hypothetical protein
VNESELLVQHAARSRFSRRRLLQSGAVAAGALAGAGAFNVTSAFGANGADPKPIPGGFDENFGFVPQDPFVHALPPGVVVDPDTGNPIIGEGSTITDFNGVVAACDVQGTANNGAYFFDCDMRFMDGLYAGEDGKLRQGSFGFV